MKDITIISLADPDYFEYLVCFVKSANVNFPSASFYAVLVNPIEGQADELKNSHDNIEVVVETKKFKSIQEKKCYCASRRAKLFYDLRSQTEDMLIWIDADSIIRGSCDDLIKHLDSCELTMRPKKTPDKFASGVIGIGNSEVCVNFIAEYNEKVSKDKSWMSDQNNLNDTYVLFKDVINFKPLPDKYCDVWLSDDGIIWEAKSKKKRGKRYVKEMKKYN
jgi:hypothetical protein